jgi:DNA-binding GntR family transcriptional regulator
MELVDRIKSLIRTPGSERGRLREATLARRLGVSRTPVRAALRHLVATGILEPEPTGGFAVLQTPTLADGTLEAATETGSLHGLIRRDIILSELGGPVSESALMRRYAVGRGELTRVIRRLVREGLAEPLPGRGWSMLSFRVDQLVKSYQLRIVLEPAILVDPLYRIDVDALARLRSDHMRLLGALGTTSPWQDIFDLDAGFHETLAAGTGNDLIVDVIRRQNRLRRLAEYVGYTRLDRTRVSMSEHVDILDALLDGDATAASALLRRHLVISREETEAHFERDLENLRQSMAALPIPG